VGPDKVGRFLVGIVPKAGELSVVWREVNGVRSALVSSGDQVVGVASCVVVDGRIAAVHFVVNPDKLGRLASAAPLTRS